MFGAGGSARAIAFTLASEAGLSRLILLNNNKERLNSLATDLKNSTDTPIKPEKLSTKSIAASMKEADLIINTTPVGMHPNKDASLIPPDLFRPEQTVFDIVYNPLDTKLLTQAKNCGLKVIQGVEMFINHAVLQFERFTGREAPVDVMRRVVMESLGS